MDSFLETSQEDSLKEFLEKILNQLEEIPARNPEGNSLGIPKQIP